MACLHRLFLLLFLVPHGPRVGAFGRTGLASVESPDMLGAVAALYQLRRGHGSRGRPAAAVARGKGKAVRDEQWLSISNSEEAVMPDAQLGKPLSGRGASGEKVPSGRGATGEYRGRNVQELFDKQVRFGDGSIAVASPRYNWNPKPVVNQSEVDMGPGEAKKKTGWAAGMNTHSPEAVAALERLCAAEDEDEKDDEYELRMKIGRLKLDAERAVATGRLDEARQLYGRCLDLRPNDVGVLANRALVLLRLGYAEEAEDDCTVALHVSGTGPSQAKLLYRRALARRERGRMSQALKDALGAALIAPRSPQIRQLIQELQQVQNLVPQCSSLHNSTRPHLPLGQDTSRCTSKASPEEGQPLLEWAGLCGGEQSAPRINTSDSNAGIVEKVMHVVRCSRHEAHEALFRSGGDASAAIDKLEQAGPHWLQNLPSPLPNTQTPISHPLSQFLPTVISIEGGENPELSCDDSKDTEDSSTSQNRREAEAGGDSQKSARYSMYQGKHLWS